MSGHVVAASTHLIGSAEAAQDPAPPHERTPIRSVTRNTRRGPAEHNFATPARHDVSARAPLSRRVPARTLSGPGGRRARAPWRTPAGQVLVSLVPSHDHNDRACAVCVSARVAILAPKASRAKVDPAELLAALGRERGNVARVARLFGISERHVRRLRAGYRPGGGIDADAVAAVIREDRGDVMRAARVFGISPRHAERIRQGWRPGGRQVPPIPYRSRSMSNGVRHGGERIVDLDHVRRNLARARRTLTETETRLAESANVAEAAEAVMARAQAIRARVIAAMAADDDSPEASPWS